MRVSTLGRDAALGHRVMTEASKVNLRHDLITNRAWSSPIGLADVIPKKKMLFWPIAISASLVSGVQEEACLGSPVLRVRSLQGLFL